jgi:hypothetical protein
MPNRTFGRVNLTSLRCYNEVPIGTTAINQSFGEFVRVVHVLNNLGANHNFAVFSDLGIRDVRYLRSELWQTVFCLIYGGSRKIKTDKIHLTSRLEPFTPRSSDVNRLDPAPGERVVRVGEGGLEPPRPCEHWHLKPARLPFRHSPE